MNSRARRAWILVQNAVGTVRHNIPKDSLSKAVIRYENFTGVAEVRQLQKGVITAQEKFMAAQEKRRKAGDKLLDSQMRLKVIHDEMQTVSKGDPNYLKLITEEHKIIVEEDALRREFSNIEKQEREYFTEMTAAVKLSHETERIYAEKNKYLYLIASIVGTVLGVMGSTINNKMKMAEFKEMIMEERSPKKLWNLNFSQDTTQERLKTLESRAVAISTNQKTILDYIIKIEKMVEGEFRETKKLMDTSNKNIAKANVVQSLSIDEENLKQICFYGALGLVCAYILGKTL